MEWQLQTTMCTSNYSSLKLVLDDQAAAVDPQTLMERRIYEGDYNSYVPTNSDWRFYGWQENIAKLN